MARLLKATEMAHLLVGERLAEGDCAVDATAGNGHDTVFLAKVVGATGRVWAFDIQAAAIEAARARVEEGGFGAVVEVVHGGHEGIAERLEPGVGAVMFNLGYLPGGDHGVVTRPETSVAGLEAAVSLLRPGGIVTCVIYTGHDGGQDEGEAVMRWAQGLAQERFAVVRYGFENQRGRPPFLLAIERREG